MEGLFPAGEGAGYAGEYSLMEIARQGRWVYFGSPLVCLLSTDGVRVQLSQVQRRHSDGE